MAAKQEPKTRDFYREARVLLRSAKTATLATVENGAPHAAFVTIAFFPDFTPILLLSELSRHTRHLQVTPACALLLAGQLPGGTEAANPPGSPEAANPQTTPRLCLKGKAAKADQAAARAVFLDSHPYATGYADFTDFAFWQVLLTECYYIGGFAAASMLDSARLASQP